ncbi:MAG: hypothetical protein HUK22_06605 [Thermoguttaceae bacterium]|nr:hypothetical protein [Thermoguttaceae bacterium]
MRKADLPPQSPRQAQMLGVGLDSDGGKRMTRGKNFTLVGGTAETHAIMQETAVKMNESLEKKGKTLEEVSPQEFRDMLYEVSEKVRR